MTAGAFQPAYLRGRPESRKDGLNARLHHLARHARTASLRTMVGYSIVVARWPDRLHGATVCRITVEQRLGKLPDDDNVRAMCKPIRDAVAKWFGVDDGPSGPLTWEYVWRRGPDRTILEVLQ